MPQQLVRLLKVFSLFLPLLLLLSFVVPFQSGAALAQGSEEPPLAKRKLIVGVTIAPPFAMQEEDGSWSGLTVDLWKEVANDLGLQYEFKLCDLKGLLAGLADSTLDAGATGLSITAAREAQFDFSTPYFVANEAVAVNADQQPNMLQVFRRAFFNWGLLTLFLFIVLVMVAGGGVLWLLENKGKADHYGGRDRKAFGRSLFWSLIVLSGRDLPQSIGWSTDSPKTVSAKLFGIVWMTVGVLLVSLFTATAASVLTSKQMQAVVNDPQDLRHVRVGTVAKSVGEDYLNRRHIKSTAYAPGAIELLTALSEHKIDAGVFNGPIMAYYAKKNFAGKVDVLRFSLRQDFMALPIPSGSPLRKSINRSLLKVLDTKRWQTLVTNYVGND